MRCERPDKDFQKLTCGYPLPCPHHTAIMQKINGHIVVGSTVRVEQVNVRRLHEIGRSIYTESPDGT